MQLNFLTFLPPNKLALLCVVFSTFNVTAADIVELYAVDYPPYMIIGPQGKVSGIDAEVTISAFASVGVPVQILTAPWKRVLKSLQYGSIAGALSCSKRSGREKFIAYSDKVSEANQVAVMKADGDDSQLNSFADLAKFKVMAVDGWGVQKELEAKKIAHITTQEMDDGIKSVVFRNVDIFYSGELTTLYRVRQLGLQDKIKTKRFVDKPSVSFHLCLNKSIDGNQALIEMFNQGLQNIKASGEFDAIYKKYL
ncbi:MAG: transporter substrate-binding domain-containing protein [Oceanospirillaceae bacterium]